MKSVLVWTADVPRLRSEDWHKTSYESVYIHYVLEILFIPRVCFNLCGISRYKRIILLLIKDPPGNLALVSVSIFMFY